MLIQTGPSAVIVAEAAEHTYKKYLVLLNEV